MKFNLKLVGLAAAIAAVSAGYSSVSNAADRGVGNTGDMAVIPYYTVRDDWVTGVHIINTTGHTQVVKLRLRRASDSADALDFNIIMSPKDEWTGFLDDSTGNIVMQTSDASCTAPVRPGGDFPMPAIYRAGADEGYIEVIAMGQPDDESMPIAVAAKHAAGVPADCTAVASNFFANVALGVPAKLGAQGNISNAVTHQSSTADEVAAQQAANNACYNAAGETAQELEAGVCATTYNSESDGLAVSYFMRDGATGIEFGGNAVHVENFSRFDEPFMTNQETGIFSGDVFGFDYPDMDGGPWIDFAPGYDFGSTLRGKYNDLRDSSVLGVSTVINDWSIASARNVSTDWIVTLPGQYTMVDSIVWLTAGFGALCGTPDDPSTAANENVSLCDFRDIPVTALLDLYDREEGVITSTSGAALTISPAPPPEAPNSLTFPNEVNVVEWTDGSNEAVLGSAVAIQVDASVLGESGWASLGVTSNKATTQQVCQFRPIGTSDTSDQDTFLNVPYAEFDVPTGRGNLSGEFPTNPTVCEDAVGQVPMVGAVVWERSFPSNPSGNYGRLIDHSFVDQEVD